MIPENYGDMPVRITDSPGRTYTMDRTGLFVRGFTDGADAVEQAVYKILCTERYRYPIYSYGYGSELEDLPGQPLSYAVPEIKRRITEALMCDSRVTGVDSFTVARKGRGVLEARFTVRTVYGDIKAEKAVEI